MRPDLKSPVVCALHEVGINADRLAQVLGCSASEWHAVNHGIGRAVPGVQRAIAALTGRRLHELWPIQYGAGGGLREGVAVYAPAPPTARYPERLSHQQIVERLVACGHGHAIRLAPVDWAPAPKSPSWTRGRSLPPYISQKAA